MSKAASWTTRLQKNKQGGYIGSVGNAILILSHHRKWRRVLEYDEFAKVVGTAKKAPFPKWIAAASGNAARGPTITRPR